MHTRVKDQLGIEFPILAFSHCRDVVAAVSRTGGLGVLGAVGHTPDELDHDLTWIEQETGGAPYGVDLLLPQKYVGADEGGLDADQTAALLPDQHRPFLAAGGIARGRQLAAALALGAEGVWCGSVWLTTEEAETDPVVKEKFLTASSADTVRSRSLTGKPARMLRTAWTDEWSRPDTPE